MSTYGQQPSSGSNPYGPPQPGQPSPPSQYGQPGQQQYGQQQPPYPGQQSPHNPYGQPGQPGEPSPQTSPPNQWKSQPPQQQPQPAALAKPTMATHPLIVATMDSVPGRNISEVVGEVLGVVARSREIPPDQRTGNPVDAYVSMLITSRQDAVERLVEMAEAAGADAVVGLRYDCSEITQSLSEVVAYGTAVKLDAPLRVDDDTNHDNDTNDNHETSAHG